jgi:hypothetical protein
MKLNMTWKDALPLLLERYYSYSGTRSSEALSALRQMADMADECACERSRQIMPYDDDATAGMSINIG